MQINPNYAMAHVWRSSCYAILGQMEEAIVEARRAQELDPFAVVVMNEVAKDLYYARKYDDAVKQFEHSIELEPDSALLHKGLAETYVQRSMFEGGMREIEKAIALSRRSVFVLDAAASVYAFANERRKSREVLAELDRLAKGSFVPFYGRAAAHAVLGDPQKALQLLEMAYDERSWLAWLKVDPAEILGVDLPSRSQGTASTRLHATAHFRAEKTPSPRLATALADMILATQEMLRDER